MKEIIREVDLGTKRVESPAMLFGIRSEEKIERFEKLLSENMHLSDSVSEAAEKIVRSALSVEFGDRISGSTFNKMARTIAAGILSDSELRKQALLIFDRFAKAEELNA